MAIKTIFQTQNLGCKFGVRARCKYMLTDFEKQLVNACIEGTKPHWQR